MKNINKLVLHIPHSSLNRYDEGWSGDRERFKEKVYSLTDMFTDELFVGPNRDDVVAVVSTVSRFFCDCERLLNDEMREIGQGIVYTRYEGFNKIISEEEILRIKDEYYFPHIQRVKDALTKNSLLIDCHSFIDEEKQGGVEINLGYNRDWSRPCYELINFISNYFDNLGYKIGLNAPFSNSLSPETNFQYPSIMIEINKKLYMEGIYHKGKNFQKLHLELMELYDRILSA